jgi:hypothetical protein
MDSIAEYLNKNRLFGTTVLVFCTYVKSCFAVASIQRLQGSKRILLISAARRFQVLQRSVKHYF